MKKTWVWVLVALVAACFVCSAGALGLGLLGAFTAGEDASTVAAPTGAPGAAGGFSFTPPEGWTSPGAGRVSTQVKDGTAVLTVEVIRMPAISGVGEPAEKLAAFWSERIGADWDGVPATPLVMRRFVGNGARAHFTSAPLRPKGGGTRARVSVYLVEAGDRLEPLVVLQQYDDPTTNAQSIKDQMAPYSWDTTHPLVEQVIAGLAGSPVGLPLVSDEELVGEWRYSTGNALQWVNTLTGSTSMTTVSYSVDYGFGEDHQFTYRFQGASGQVGALEFQGDADEGEWKVEHDVLVLQGGARTVKYLVAGAARAPSGKRALFLLPEKQWSLSPGAVAMHGELYVEK